MYKIYYNREISFSNKRAKKGENMLKNRILIGRAEKKWTQQQLADAVGVSRQTIVALEQNKYNPSLVLAFKIAAALEKEITNIFEYRED